MNILGSKLFNSGTPKTEDRIILIRIVVLKTLGIVFATSIHVFHSLMQISVSLFRN